MNPGVAHGAACAHQAADAGAAGDASAAVAAVAGAAAAAFAAVAGIADSHSPDTQAVGGAREPAPADGGAPAAGGGASPSRAPAAPLHPRIPPPRPHRARDPSASRSPTAAGHRPARTG